jgi:hypothetical protein
MRFVRKFVAFHEFAPARKIVVSREIGSLNNCIASNGPATMVRIEIVGYAVNDGPKRFVRIGRGKHAVP